MFDGLIGLSCQEFNVILQWQLLVQTLHKTRNENEIDDKLIQTKEQKSQCDPLMWSVFLVMDNIYIDLLYGSSVWCFGTLWKPVAEWPEWVIFPLFCVEGVI